MRLVICGSNRILCEALAAALDARGHVVAAMTVSAGEGLAAVAEHRPDLLLMDLSLPGGLNGRQAEGIDGLRTARVVRQQYEGTAVLVLSSLSDPATRSAAMKSGVAGFLRKNRSVNEIAAALDVIAAGGVVADPGLAGGLDRHTARRHTHPVHALTPREKEVLRRIVAGHSTEQMAQEMHIETSTLRTYVKNVLTKLGAHSRLQAAALATHGNLLRDLSA